MTAPTAGTAVVIGGGISGLATAALLAREGYRVTLVEARAELGGRVGSWERDGFRFDTGPSWYLMPEVFDHFYRLLGTSTAEQLDLKKLDPGYRVFFEKHPEPVDIVADMNANIETFEQIEAGAGNALRRYLASATDTFHIALQSFLYSTFASFRPLVNGPVLTRAGRLGRLLAQPLDRFIARSFADVRLRQILGYPAVFLGSSPSMTPSLYHLMSHLDLKDGVYYPAGGFTEVIQSLVRLAETEGVEIVTEARASVITTITTRQSPRPHVTGVEFTDSDGASKRIAADLVVSAADLHHTETTLLSENLRSYPEKWWQKRVAGPGAVLVYLGVSGSLPELAHHSLFFTEDWADNFGRIFNEPTSVPSPASVYVCRPSATDSTVAPADHENLFVLVPVPADPGIGRGGVDGGGDRKVEEVADEVIHQLGDWAKIPDLAERIVVRKTVGPADFEGEFNSWKGSALGPAHTLRQSAFLRGKNASAKVDGLIYAGGTTVPGIGLPMCLISAELVIKRLRNDVSASALPEPL
ncbi:phytoene desaturase family protein [Homoserinimonas sp. OAct 916]|uniref:phytoene desaturase family protein n=1 Tax=Homoserinimonas sp. OAct 916 TaxID=2211450 RepID=UPI001300BAAA|nr:phytoene desaturase family protein [Homoserinimonas sp. OAct 916]